MFILLCVYRLRILQCQKNMIKNCNIIFSRSLKNTKQWEYKLGSSYFWTALTTARLRKLLIAKICISEIIKKSVINRTFCAPQISQYHCSLSKTIVSYSFRLISFMWNALLISVRFFQLSCIFVPLLIAYPISLIHANLRSLWYSGLLLGIELSGPIIVKLGQWASTRRDLFSEELCCNLSKLQRETQPHSWYYTKKCLKTAFGPCWNDIFIEFENNGQPIGSGCCAQVYKVWIRKDITELNVSTILSKKLPVEKYTNIFGDEVLELTGIWPFSSRYKKELKIDRDQLMPVAVKVLHPHIDIHLRQDLCILKTLASFTTWLLPQVRWLSLCECVDEFSQVMKQQVNLNVEAHNLVKFSDNFKNSTTVKFPHPLWMLTRSNILVESFEEGQHMQDYVKNENKYIKTLLAELGINTVLKMIFQDNFIHSDLHPGNMLVQENPNFNNEYSTFWHPWIKISPFQLVILDCGIVATLDEQGKSCLRDVFAAVALDDGEKVADLFLKYSNHRCTDISGFRREMKEIVHSTVSKTVTLQQVDVTLLMKRLFLIMINYQVKVDSRFSSVILAIMVIEGLGRSLDPTIDIIDKARPFLFK